MPNVRAIGMALVFAAACVSQAAAPQVKVLKVGETSISLSWDASWQVGQLGSEAPPNSAQFQAANAHDMVVLLTAQPKPSADADADDFVKFVIDKAIEEFQPLAVEKKLEPRAFSNGGVRGQIVCATDRAPKPEEYKYVCQGIATNDVVALVFTVLYNEPGKAQAEKATRSLEALRFTQGT